MTSIHSTHSTPTFSFLLQRVLADPKLLNDFEKYLCRTWCHENLLFIEAMNQLRHEENSRSIEHTLQRIYKTFIAIGSPMELNISTQDYVKRRIESLQWSIIDKETALDVLKETESEVLVMLQTKLSDYIHQSSFKNGELVDHPELTNHSQINVVIIGGGFVGFTVASILDVMPVFNITLIDTKSAFEYTPGIVKKLVNPFESTSLRVTHDSYVKNGKVIIGYVEEISEDGKSVIVNDEKIPCDYLVMATGSSYNARLKSDDVSALYRLTGLEETYAELLSSQNILIIGGGLVGCELASEIAQTSFPGPYPNKKITLVESNECIVSRSNPEQKSKAEKYLKSLGVKIICNERIIDFDAASTNNTYIGTSGELYQDFDKVFLTTGTTPNSGLFLSHPSLSTCVDLKTNRIRVRPTLQVEHWEFHHIFAGGDITNVNEEKTGYAATLAGVCIARNICRLVKGKEPLKQGEKGTLAAPNKPLHGTSSHGGIGKQKLGKFKKVFSFLNPSWAALKYFDEQQFLQLVQGQRLYTTHGVIGRLPRLLTFNTIDQQLAQLMNPNSPSSTTLPPLTFLSNHPSSIMNLKRSPSTLRSSFSRKPSSTSLSPSSPSSSTSKQLSSPFYSYDIDEEELKNRLSYLSHHSGSTDSRSSTNSEHSLHQDTDSVLSINQESSSLHHFVASHLNLHDGDGGSPKNSKILQTNNSHYKLNGKA
ncbi:unnamed protein product [Cunninghamella echinulata]